MFQKIKENNLLRISGVILCVPFILGAALNDGWTAWFWGLPFVFLIYALSNLPKKQNTMLFIGIIGAMLLVSELKSVTGLVYPVIGSEVVTIKDIPVVAFESDIPTYDFYPDEDYQSRTNRSIIATGTKFTVVVVKAYHPDFDLKHRFVLANEDSKVAFDTEQLESAIKPLCYSVSGEICRQNMDPMRPLFRCLTSLMYYPVPPIVWHALKQNCF